MKAFITGIAGFAGSHLADRLLEDGAEVSGLVIEGDLAENLATVRDRVRLETGDVRDRDRLTALFREIRPGVIYHLAGVTSVRQASGDPEEAFSVNVDGARSICGAVIDSGIEAEVLIVTSCEVYGDHAGPIDETAPLRPANAYALSKAAADLLAYQQHAEHGLRTIRLRPFNHTGPRQAPAFVCSDFARQIAGIEAGIAPPRLSVGNLENVRDFLSVADVAEAYRIAPGRLEPGGAYNIASGEGRTIREILDLLLGMTGAEIDVRTEVSRRRAGDPRGMVGDASLFRSRTGWEAAHPLDEALRGLLEYWRSRLSSSHEPG